MKYSEHALRALLALESGKYNTRAKFWRNFPNSSKLKESYPKSFEELVNESRHLLTQLEMQRIDGMLCAFDVNFPQIPEKKANRTKNTTNCSKKPDYDLPILLFYRGDINLLTAPIRVAVIGTTKVTDEIKNREETIVSSLVDHGAVIVSGLALGCDSIGHKCCIDHGGKTIAILPSTIEKIIPQKNSGLAEDIVTHGGLLITEYYKDASSSPDNNGSATPIKSNESNINKFEQTRRYIDRDRLQAYFSKAVILISSYGKVDNKESSKHNDNNNGSVKEEGKSQQSKNDSGSRHTLDEAEKRGISRYVMYKKDTDSNDPVFEMNKDIYTKDPSRLLCKNTINIICAEPCSNQMSLFS